MCDFCKMWPCPYYMNAVRNNPYNMNEAYEMNQCPYCGYQAFYNQNVSKEFTNQYINSEDNNLIELKDYGPKPFVVNIEEATKENDAFRTALWTGKYLQLTLMSIDVGGEIGLEIHPNLDQFIRIEEGEGLVKMGYRKDKLNFQAKVYDDFVFIIPAGTWHNLINTGNKPIKLYSIYAPPQHPHGTVHKTKADADTAEENHQ